ncbi:MAG: glycerol-3-phosphate dehydrogenase [Francisellaceae bacterium]
MNEIETDLLVIGGGINGTGIAADAALRGLSVVLCEESDLASATSSASSKLVHGGLRYLEQYEFKLVKEALKEREVLLKKAPHLIHPLRFILPHAKHLRPKWMIRIGMFLYDFLAGKMSLPKSGRVSLVNNIKGAGLIDDFKVGFEYSDCRIDDARMVLTNALEAKEAGATVLIPYRCVAVERLNGCHIATLKCQDLSESSDKTVTIKACAVVNAAGPWVADVVHNVLDVRVKSAVKLVKGSHIVVPRLYEGDHAYILQNADGRIVFALPFGFSDEHQNDFTLIGTTDVNFTGDPRGIAISDEERQYLCDLINQYFKHKISVRDIIWDYAGVRPLYDDNTADPSKITREYHLELEDDHGRLPVLSVFGGKITTYRTLSKHVLDKLKPYFPQMGECKTASQPSPGGSAESFADILAAVKSAYPWLENQHAYHLSASYGMLSLTILGQASSYEDLGQHFGFHFYEKEARYLIEHEWCDSMESMLWRRSKLGLWLNANEQDQLKAWLDKV